jgi:hypothetical protein
VSTDPSGAPGAPGAGGPATGAQPSEEELRAAYEAELSRITSADMMLQAAVSLLNIASFKLAPPPGDAAAAGGAESDLEQVRDAIDGVRALLEILERRVPGELAPLRNALSQLQMAYAREAQAAGGEPAAPSAQAAAPGDPQDAAGQGGPGTGESPPGEGSQQGSGPGPAESSGRLWVPGR